jgi:hypothetical protein
LQIREPEEEVKDQQRLYRWAKIIRKDRMTSYIEEFNRIEKPKDYYDNLFAQLEKLNEEYHAFNVINNKTNPGFLFSTKANICVKV